MNNFDVLAPVYDALVRLVYGNTLHKANIHFLDKISSRARVLVLGGGTGKILAHLKNNPVVYIEKSKNMLERAKKRPYKGRVDFICADFFTWQSDQSFDVVICPFFLDVFSETNLKLVLKKINDMTVVDGKLIVTDFQNTGRYDHRILLSSMHLFFRITTQLEGHQLLAIEEYILQKAFKRKEQATFRRDFVFTTVYDRMAHE